MLLPLSPPVTTAVEVPFVIVALALFVPTSPPTEPVEPVADTELLVLTFDRLPLLLPINPPADTNSPVADTGLAALRFDRLAALLPISPPMFAKPPVLTVPVALEFVIVRARLVVADESADPRKRARGAGCR